MGRKESLLKNLTKNPPNELKDLFYFLEKNKIEITPTFFYNLVKNYNKYIIFLKRIKENWLPKNKKYSDLYIAGQLFKREIDKKDYSSWCKIQLYALIESVERIYKNINNIINDEFETEDVKFNLLNDELYLLKEIAFESINLMVIGERYINNLRLSYIERKRNVFSSLEPFALSEMVLRRNFYSKRFGAFMFESVSMFLIRQAIELRLKKMFGIESITDKDGKEKVFSSIKLILLINEEQVEFPVAKTILKKIYEWSNYFIHGGLSTFLWQIEWAQYLLKPVFSGGTDDVSSSAFGSIKIKSSYFNEIDEKILQMIDKNKINTENLSINFMDYPECIIVKDDFKIK